MKTRTDITKAHRWVIKIGSALLTDDGRGLDNNAMGAWVDQIAQLLRSGREVVVVSSGSVAEGMNRLGWKQRPHALHELQAAAAVGQMGLIQAYESHFQRHGLHTAQILLTHDDLADRQRYLNARSTIRSLLSHGVVPVVNENDTVAIDEIRFGDNDTLAALVANITEADVLVILTDQQGLYDKDPRKHADANLIHEGKAGDVTLEKMASSRGGSLGQGGMLTKVLAATRAARSGAATIIAAGAEDNVLGKLARGEQLGTLLLPGSEPLLARKQWLAGQLKVKGRLVLDAGAVKVLRDQGKSLLSVGVTAVDGKFLRGELVSCVTANGEEIARGLVNYNADESRQLMGKSTDQIEAVLGYIDEAELIHRDDLVVL